MAVGVSIAIVLLSGCADEVTPKAGESSSSSTPAPEVTATFTIPTLTTSRAPATPQSTPVTAPDRLPPELAEIDREDPTAVAEAVAQLWYSWDTTVDFSTYDARLRAVPLLDPALAASITSFPPISGPGVGWLDLTAQNARLTVDSDSVSPAAEGGAPPDSASSAYRLLQMTQKVTTPRGPLPDRTVVVAFALVHGADGWRVGKVQPR